MKRATRGRRKPVSDAWKTMKRCHLALYPECRICGVTEGVVVHHLRYRGQRGVGEKPGDLVTLCSSHHDEFHTLYGRAGQIKGSLPSLTIEFITQRRHSTTLRS